MVSGITPIILLMKQSLWQGCLLLLRGGNVLLCPPPSASNPRLHPYPLLSVHPSINFPFPFLSATPRALCSITSGLISLNQILGCGVWQVNLRGRLIANVMCVWKCFGPADWLTGWWGGGGVAAQVIGTPQRPSGSNAILVGSPHTPSAQFLSHSQPPDSSPWSTG